VKRRGIGLVFIIAAVAPAEAQEARDTTALPPIVVAAAGTPREVLRREVVERVFAWPVAITEWDGVPQVVPLDPTASRSREGGQGAEGQRGSEGREHREGGDRRKDIGA
jgi:hypothetical protein